MNDTEAPLEQVCEDLAGLMPGFLELSRAELAAMRQALAGLDFATLVRLGHSARGAGANYNMLGLARLGGDVEAAARRLDVPALGDLLERMEAYLADVRISYVPE